MYTHAGVAPPAPFETPNRLLSNLTDQLGAKGQHCLPSQRDNGVLKRGDMQSENGILRVL